MPPQEVTLSEMEAALGGVAVSQSQVAESVAEAAEGVQRLEHHSAAITAQLETSVAQGDVLLRKQKVRVDGASLPSVDNRNISPMKKI
jgi:hypothetical protein